MAVLRTQFQARGTDVLTEPLAMRAGDEAVLLTLPDRAGVAMAPSSKPHGRVKAMSSSNQPHTPPSRAALTQPAKYSA